MDFSALLVLAQPWLDAAGIAVFAISGALAAARAGQTPVTFAFFAVVTGVGGGTVRDLLIGAPVFWIVSPLVSAVCLSAAGAVWLIPSRWWPSRAIEWFDAMGIAWYGVYGASKALDHGVPALPSVIMGIVTASVGGIIRDILAHQPSIIVRPEIYVTAIALSSATYVTLVSLGANAVLAATIAVPLGFALRALAIVKGLALPGYRA
ncbi:MAG: TRIC cation channel family protein [Methylobacterium mesophilicum]|nr:TRIC cation channel family protein [Methylobacterium mesophilicum]